MFSFLKSKSFWIALAHIAVIGAGAYGSFVAGTPLPMVITSAVNALVPSPTSTSIAAAAKQSSSK